MAQRVTINETSCGCDPHSRKRNIYLNLYFHAVALGQSWGRGIKCDCKIDWLWVRSLLEEVPYFFNFIFSFLRSGVDTQCLQNSSESGERSVCTLSSLYLPLLCAEYSVKLIYFYFIYIFISSLVYPMQSATLSSATQHEMLPEFGGKKGMECLNTRFVRFSSFIN